MTQSDQNIRNLSEIFYNSVKAIDEDELLDPDHLAQFKKKTIKPLYPLKIVGDQLRKYQCCQACCESPGFLYCCKSKKGDKEFESLGLSVNLYFKFLKHFLIFFLFMSTLAILSCAVCYKVAQQNDINPLSGYSTFLFSTTYGAFSSETDKCHYSLLKKGLISYQATFNIVCQTGVIRELGVVLSDESLNSTYNCRKQSKKIGGQADKAEKSSRLPPLLTPLCSEQESCSISLNYLLTLDSNTYNTVSYSYQCIENKYSFGQLYLYSQDYFRFIVGVDIFIFLWLILFFCCNSSAEQSEKAQFKKSQLSLDDFSLKLKGFQYNTAEPQLQAFFTSLKKKDEFKKIQTMISAFTFTESKRMLEYYDDKYKIFDRAYALIRQYFFDSHSKRNLRFDQCYTLTFEGDQGAEKMKSYKQKLSTVKQEILTFLKVRIQIQNESTDNTTALIVFSKIQTKRRVMKQFNDSCCSKNQINLGRKKYIASNPPLPDMFILQNKYSWTKLRVLISWLLTIIICAGSYLLFGYIQLKQNELFTDYNYGIDCKVLYSSADLLIINANLLVQDNYVTCICKDSNLLNLSSNNDDYCTTWSKKYALYLIVPLLISFGIVIYNVIVSQFFRLLSKFQRHKFVIDEEISYTFKRAFLLILNMGLIMILLNFNYKKSLALEEISFIFLGRFDDFTVDWYENIGSIIILTMIFNIATPIAEFFLSFMAKCFKKCWDTKCYSKVTSKQRKQQYIEMYSNDIFPIGERYAYLISTFFITFSFCGVIPILVPVCCLTFFLLYTTDKILIFKFYQKPMNYTQNLHKILHNVLVISLLSHFALTSYFLTEPSLIAPNNTQTIDQQFSSDQRLQAMIRVYYIYPYLGFIALILIWIVLKLVFGSLFSLIAEKCSKDDSQSGQKSYLVRDLSIENTLSPQQAQALKQLYQYNIKKYDQKYGTQGILKKVMQSLFNQQIQSEKRSNPILQSILKRSKQAIQRTITKLKDKEKSITGLGCTLLGLPSYDYLMINKKVTRNQQMMAIEQRLLSIYKPKGSIIDSPIKNQTKMEQSYPNLSGENLNKGGTI